MEVEVEDRIALAAKEIGRCHPVQLAMKPRERQGVRAVAPRTAPEVREHRWPVDPLENQVGAAHVDDSRRGISPLAHVSHDRDLAVGHRAVTVAAQDARFVDREDVGVLSARKEGASRGARRRHLGSRRNSTTLPCSHRYVATEFDDSIRPVWTPSTVDVPLEVTVYPPPLCPHRWLEVLPPPFAKHSTVGGVITAMKRRTRP